MAKPLSLADRIRAQRKKNRSDDEDQTEKNIINQIESIEGEDFQNQYSDLVTQRHSDIVTNPPTSLVTQRPSDQPTNIVAGLVTYRPSDLVTSNNKRQPNIKKPADLTIRQFKILEYIYFNRPFKVYTENGLGSIDNMGPNNAKNQIKSLTRKGYIFKPYSVNDGVTKGSTCRVDDTKCIPIFGPTSIPNPPEKKLGQKDLVAQRPSDLVTGIEETLIRSSSYNKKTTTIQNCSYVDDNEKIILDIMSVHPEYKFWFDHQVTAKQVARWKYEFGLDLQTILNNLCYVRWQIVAQKTTIKKSVADYLYKIMLKNGGTVNRPSGYKTMAQIDREHYEDLIKKQKDHAKEMERLKNEAIKAEIEPKIDALLKKPELKNEYIQAAVKKIRTEDRRNRIIRNIKTGRSLDDKSKNILKGYLEQILLDEMNRNYCRI